MDSHINFCTRFILIIVFVEVYEEDLAAYICMHTYLGKGSVYL
jgi:hypothetical protein